jgi:hypothetical protein
MENYLVTIYVDKEVHHFEVGEYMHHADDQCKYRVYENGAYVASFTPDDHDFCISARIRQSRRRNSGTCWLTRSRRIIRRGSTGTSPYLLKPTRSRISNDTSGYYPRHLRCSSGSNLHFYQGKSKVKFGTGAIAFNTNFSAMLFNNFC